MHKWSNAGLLVTILSTYIKRSPVSLPAVYYGGRLRGVMRRGNANLFSASLRHWKCCPPHHQWGWCTPFSMRFLSPYCPPFPLPWAHWPEASLMSFLPMSPPVLEPLKFMLPGLSSLAGFSNPIILSQHWTFQWQPRCRSISDLFLRMEPDSWAPYYRLHRVRKKRSSQLPGWFGLRTEYNDKDTKLKQKKFNSWTYFLTALLHYEKW